MKKIKNMMKIIIRKQKESLLFCTLIRYNNILTNQETAGNKMNKRCCIGVFDWGEKLSVLKQIVKLLPNENIIYFEIEKYSLR